MFNSLDKALTDRHIRYVMQMAAELKSREAPAGVWPKTAEGRKAKRLFDIYGRDAADMKALQARLIRDHADPLLVESMAKRKVPRAPKAKTVEQPVMGDAERSLLSARQDFHNQPGATIVGAGAVPGAQRVVDWKADAGLIGNELEQFEQCGKPPADLADQAAVVVGANE